MDIIYLFVKNRCLGRGGGVALYLANYLAFSRRLDLEFIINYTMKFIELRVKDEFIELFKDAR
jgi:hypothetical protein